MARRYVYLNYAQQEFYHCACRNMRAVFARRTGKTHGMLSPFIHKVQKSMPRGHGAFLGLSRKQIMAKTMPAVTMSFNSMWGLREGENYIFGKPPAKLNYPDPIYKPRDWSNTMSFANGFYWSLVSLSVTGSANGETFSAVVGDEAKFWSYDKLVNEVMPANSGVIHPYGDPSHSMLNPFYKSTCFVSDASLSSKGSWLEREEAKMDAVIENGPNKGKTSRQLLDELKEYSRRIIDINDVVYFAKKNGKQPQVVPKEKMEYVRLLRKMIEERRGKFHLPGMDGKITQANLRMLVEYKTLTEADAELVWNSDYMLSEEDYLFSRLVKNNEKYQQHIQQLRGDCFAYFQGSSIDNIALLTPQYISDMARDLPPLIFAISILGIKMKISGEGFYYALDVENHHGYIDDGDNDVIEDNTRVKTVSRVYNGKEYKAEVETPDFERIAEINDCRMDGDLSPSDELFIALDYNSRINWLVIGVVRKDPNTNRDTLFVINSMYVKNPERIETLMKKFNRYYAPHRRQNPHITYFYDSTATRNEGYASEGSDKFIFKNLVMDGLTAGGWIVRPVYMGKQAAHDYKYEVINNGLKEISYPAIRFNRQKNEALLVSIENAGVKQGYNGFEKDKSGEKLAYNPDMESTYGAVPTGRTSADGKKQNVPEEYRTDGSDAFDTLYLGVKFFRYSSSGVFACG